MTIREQKKRMRAQVEARRSAMPEKLRRDKSAEICRRSVEILETLDWTAGGALMAYMPFRSEVDVSPIVEWCWMRGIAVAAPRALKEQRLLRLHAIANWDDVETGAYGIREPLPGCPELSKDDVFCVIVPGVAFDERRGRLGYGGGYYDRFFESLGGSQPFKLALAFDSQIVPAAPMDAHDIRVDRIVTESRCL